MSDTVYTLNRLIDITEQITAPALVSYVWWVLNEAEKMGLKKLYFLARDGYMMHKIAEILCEKYSLDISCEYLYCSRYALRIPAFHILNKEAYRLIFGGGYRITKKIVLSRAALNSEERAAVYADIGLAEKDENISLSKLEYNKFAEKVSKSKIFNQILFEKSKSEYESTIGYLKQQGLTEVSTIGIVDTGWTGSIQRTLRQLLESCGAVPQIIGFYYGMYEKPREAKDGIYKPYYFNHKSNPFIAAKFNNNLFECLCSAPHGTTVGYKKDNDRYLPVLSDTPVNPIIIMQVELIEKACKSIINQGNFLYQDKLCGKKLQALMINPTKEQAQIFSAFHFCDDVCESYMKPLVEKPSVMQIKQYNVILRLTNKMLRCNLNNQKIDSLFWPYGAIALSDIPNKWYYRLNVLAWDVMRNCIKFL